MPGLCASKEACSIASILPNTEHQSSHADILLKVCEIQNCNNRWRTNWDWVKAPRRVPCPMVGHLKHSFFGLSQPAREGHHVLSQLFDWQRFIYHRFYCSNGSW